MISTQSTAQTTLGEYGQEHVLQFWDALDNGERESLLAQLAEVHFPTMQRLINEWVLHEPAAESFQRITTVDVTLPVEEERPDARDALDAGETALRAGRVACVMVAGGQGTRLGFDGPKGAYPIGPLTGKSLFAYHAEKVRNLQNRYACAIPWYIMVSHSNAAATEAFFKQHDYFGLSSANIRFFQQKMVPCVDEKGKFMLEAPGRLAMNPNGHGGCILALVDEGIISDTRERGIDTLSYFQVDNWALKPADPYFIGYHVLRGSEMSSKVHRKRNVRESVGVHCICDGEYRVIEYSELDFYPQLLETDAEGKPVHFAGNPAIHILATEFVNRVYHAFESFPWHRAHKKIPFLNTSEELVKPDKPNGYKFETFIFDALRLARTPCVALEIHEAGEYTPIKQFDGDNSVVSARRSMRNYWASWFDAAGWITPRNVAGDVTIQIEISPVFAFTKKEFVEKSRGRSWDTSGDLAIEADGSCSDCRASGGDNSAR